MHRSGFVNIIGNPNVGKSTLMNALVGERISIITSKSQTTRHRILGIVNGDDFQIVYSDTPGIIKPNYKLQEKMMDFVSVSFDDADVFLYVTDVVESAEKNAEYIERLSKVKIPVLCLINKIDLVSNEEVENLRLFWENRLPNAKIFEISALNGTNLDIVFNEIVSLLPEGPAWFPKDQLTDKTERFIVSEIIREKILLNYKKEIPYSCEVAVEEFKESPDIIRIKAVIIVERPSQKGIIIGNKGASIKKVGTEARIDIEKFFGKKVFLETFVKVEKDWRNNDRDLSRFGYNI
ncbi:MAG: GTPase Era [Bacteroidales bacterium]|jgi:GTP-binding protein Era|nr:GTPase Era [Bacteroidales bacterium]MBQ1719565.1 GTPase Era [Bacteroidales bacterium]MBQ2543082.1 GTPase Era [Bacteroidales bacterium]MBQ2574518.1 GTPase Era [Bacteroidales bacterium]MBQ4475459.1 GTPase Era [Bacteroidales bacterium]